MKKILLLAIVLLKISYSTIFFREDGLNLITQGFENPINLIPENSKLVFAGGLTGILAMDYYLLNNIRNKCYLKRNKIVSEYDSLDIRKKNTFSWIFKYIKLIFCDVSMNLSNISTVGSIFLIGFLKYKNPEFDYLHSLINLSKFAGLAFIVNYFSSFVSSRFKKSKSKKIELFIPVLNIFLYCVFYKCIFGFYKIESPLFAHDLIYYLTKYKLSNKFNFLLQLLSFAVHNYIYGNSINYNQFKDFNNNFLMAFIANMYNTFLPFTV
jgi:hypothetical protein